MCRLLLIYIPTSLLLMLGGCREPRGTTATSDACSLVSKQEVESVQAALMKEAKSSERSDGIFQVSQCFYAASEFSKSVNLALVQIDPKQHSKRSPKDFWKEKFGPYGGSKSDPDGKSGKKSPNENESGAAPKKIGGLGDEAYWVSNRFGGVLYVLKGDVFISVGIGGTDDEGTKLERSKALAKKALQRL